jgi:hypothetical protein
MLYTITLLVLVCPDLLKSVEDTCYGIRGVVHRITVTTMCLLFNLFLSEVQCLNLLS